jgi:hypothetical protein
MAMSETRLRLIGGGTEEEILEELEESHERYDIINSSGKKQ